MEVDENKAMLGLLLAYVRAVFRVCDTQAAAAGYADSRPWTDIKLASHMFRGPAIGDSVFILPK